MSAATPRKHTSGDVLRALRRPKVLAMLLLGFSSGLPLYLVGNTMGYWMRENGSELSAIGFLSWVGLAYTLKFLWAPLLDRWSPARSRGHYRTWLLVLQPLMVVAGDHANQDMAGEEEDSWKSRLERAGYQVECRIRGLGEVEAIRKLYVAHVREAEWEK